MYYHGRYLYLGIGVDLISSQCAQTKQRKQEEIKGRNISIKQSTISKKGSHGPRHSPLYIE